MYKRQRKQTVERVAFLEPKTSFRSAYAYDNILYAVAGQLIEEVTGCLLYTFRCG